MAKLDTFVNKLAQFLTLAASYPPDRSGAFARKTRTCTSHLFILIIRLTGNEFFSEHIVQLGNITRIHLCLRLELNVFRQMTICRNRWPATLVTDHQRIIIFKARVKELHYVFGRIIWNKVSKLLHHSPGVNFRQPCC